MRKWKKECAGFLAAAMTISTIAPGAVTTVDAANSVVERLTPKWQYDFDGSLNEANGAATATAKAEHLSVDYTGNVIYDTGRDGTGQSVYLDGNYGLDLNLPTEGRTADYTISFWANPQADLGWADSLINWGMRNTGGNDNWVSLAGNGIWSAINNNNNTMVGYTRVNNEWQQYIISVEGNKASVYRNGVLNCTQTVSETAFTNEQSTVCLAINAWDANANCKYDEVKVYDKAVSADEAKLLYSGSDCAIETEAQNVRVGETIELNTVNVSELADCTVSWTSGDPAVATVEDGIVTGTGEGTAVITANWSRNGEVVASDSVSINVLQKKLIADFTFDDAETGLAGSGAKATMATEGNKVAFAVDGDRKVLKFSGVASDATDENWLNVTKEDGSSLLGGLTEFTVSYDSSSDGAFMNCWTFFADQPNVAASDRHYIALADYPTHLDIERYNEGVQSGEIYSGWKHVDVVFNENATTIYIDGEMAGTNVNTHTVADSLGENCDLMIGKATWGNEYWAGMLDNYKIYNYALTAEEVADEFAGKGEVDKTVLQTAVDSAIADTEADTYTETSWTAYAAALADANAVLANADATQEEVDAAVAALADATAALVTKAEELASIKAAAIEELNSYAKEDDYREDEKETPYHSQSH